MSQEIIYTSAPKGLKAGSRGFCTVVSTAGMAKNLAERLESLSGYRHQFMPGEDGENPVNYSHLRFTVGGTQYHVLSRICDAGLDYTKRTNKLAHHIALTTTETTKAPGGPAWAISQNDFLVEQWDGRVQTLPESYRTLTTKPCPIAKCSTWASLGVDAGWAGVLAETAVKKSSPMTVIFRGGVDTRALVREALALVPPDKRWDVTFTTYFTKLPAGVDCMWRFVPDGTPEALALRRNPHASVIDLCNPTLGPAPASELADLARTGAVVKVAVPEPAAPTAKSGRRQASAPEFSAPPSKAVARDAQCDLRLEDEIHLAPVSVTLPPLHTDPRFAGNRRSKLLSLFLAAALGVLIAVGMVGAYLAGTQSVEIAKEEPAAHTASVGEPTDPPEAPLPSEVGPEPEMEEYDPLDALSEEAKQSIDSAEQDVEQARTNQEKDQAEASRAAAEGPSQELDAHDKPTEAPVEQLHKPFDHILTLENRLKLPKAPTPSKIDASPPKFEELAKLYVDTQAECDIKLRGNEVDSQSDRDIITQRAEKDGVVSWTILAKFKSSLNDPKEVGTFQLNDQSLQFRWGKEPAVPLQLCLLDITVRGQTQTCSLIHPEEMPAVQMDFRERVHRIDLKLPNELPVRLDVSFEGEGFGDVRIEKGQGLKRGEKAVIRIPNPNGIGRKQFIEIETTFEMNSTNRGLQLEAFGYPLFIDFDSSYATTATSEGEPTEPNLAEKKTNLSDRDLGEAKRLCRETLETLRIAKQRNDKEKEDLKPVKQKHDAKVFELERAKSNAAEADAKKGIQQDIDKENNKYRKIANGVEQRAKWLSKYEELVKQNEQWAKDVVDLLDKVHKDGRIHFRVYFETEGVELDLVKSK